MSRKRWPEIDALYTIGILLVVFGHSHSSDWSSFSGTVLEHTISFIYTFHMPLFFFIAGFLFENSNAIERLGYRVWFKKKTVRLLTPYVILSIVALIPKYYVENHGFAGFSKYLMKAILVPRVGVWGHFWFLPVLLLIYLAFGLGSITIKNRNSNIFIYGAAIVSIILYFLPFQTQWFGFGDFKEASIYFTLGLLVYNLLIKTDYAMFGIVRLAWMIVGIAISMLIVHNFYYSRIMMLMEAIIMISVCWQVAAVVRETNLTRWLSSNNFTIYIYSWPFQSVMMTVAGYEGLNWYMTCVSMFVVGLAAPILIVVIYRRFTNIHNRIFDLLIGIK